MPAMAQTGSFDVDITSPAYFSVKVPDGNYKVTVTLGSKKRKAETVVRAESRRLMVEGVLIQEAEEGTDFRAILEHYVSIGVVTNIS